MYSSSPVQVLSRVLSRAFSRVLSPALSRVRAALLIGVSLSAASLLLAACGSSGSSGSGNPHLPTDEVTVANVSSLGQILVDGQGRTLYVYAPDAHSGGSKCTGACLAAWPPLVLSNGAVKPKAGPGVTASKLGTTHTAGQTQITYAGWPLYTWTGDGGPGDATGQGLFNAGGYWYVIRSSGTIVR